MTAFHVSLMILLLCVNDGSGCRAGIHNGYHIATLHILCILCIRAVELTRLINTLKN